MNGYKLIRYVVNGLTAGLVISVFYIICVELRNDHSVRQIVDDDLDINSHYRSNRSAQNVSVETRLNTEVSVVAGQLEKQLPSAIIFGVAKCGTRAILSFFRIHPDISLGWHFDMPEVNFFTDHFSDGLKWYREQMPPSLPGQITIEKSPNYFPDSTVPHRIRNYNSSIKLILTVCNPVRRSLSQYAGELERAQSQGNKYPLFEDLAIDTQSGEINEHYHTVTFGCYADLLLPWLQSFPLEQIHLVDGDELRRDPVPEMNKLEAFLGLRTYISHSHFTFNSTKGFYCINRPIKGPECLGETKGREHPAIKESVNETLHTYYSKCNERFYDIVNRRFKW